MEVRYEHLVCFYFKEQILIFVFHSLVLRRRQWHPTLGLLPGKFHGWRRLVGCSPWGREELNTTEQLHFHFSLSCTGEGNGNPLQGSYLENPRDGGAWWAAIYRVAQSQTQLKWLSSSSSFGSELQLNYSEWVNLYPLHNLSQFCGWSYLITLARSRTNVLVIRT